MPQAGDTYVRDVSPIAKTALPHQDLLQLMGVLFSLFLPDVVSTKRKLKYGGKYAKNCPRPYVLFALFASICEGCYSGSVIKVLKEIQTKGGDGLDIYCFVSKKYSENDILGMTSQLSIDFPVSPIDVLFSRRWDELTKIYGEDSLNAVVFIMDNNARVVDVLPSAQTARPFFDRCLRRSMVKYEKQ